ncbi:MAG: hypothetical protein WCM76_03785 [Bacteroidota bacterium]
MSAVPLMLMAESSATIPTMPDLQDIQVIGNFFGKRTLMENLLHWNLSEKSRVGKAGK